MIDMDMVNGTPGGWLSFVNLLNLVRKNADIFLRRHDRPQPLVPKDRYIYLQVTTALDWLSLVKLRADYRAGGLGGFGAVLKQRTTDSSTSDKNKTEETVHVRW